ncbi:MAG: dTDP-4-dehydrorhamnose 3,5-epimerase family protein, partial [Pseudomonadota bacterium]
FVTRAPWTEVLYKCTAHYAPDHAGVVRWDSAGIDWGLTDDPILSAQDAAAPPLADFDSPFAWKSA